MSIFYTYILYKNIKKIYENVLTFKKLNAILLLEVKKNIKNL